MHIQCWLLSTANPKPWDPHPDPAAGARHLASLAARSARDRRRPPQGTHRQAHAHRTRRAVAGNVHVPGAYAPRPAHARVQAHPLTRACVRACAHPARAERPQLPPLSLQRPRLTLDARASSSAAPSPGSGGARGGELRHLDPSAAAPSAAPEPPPLDAEGRVVRSVAAYARLVVCCVHSLSGNALGEEDELQEGAGLSSLTVHAARAPTPTLAPTLRSWWAAWARSGLRGVTFLLLPSTTLRCARRRHRCCSNL